MTVGDSCDGIFDNGGSIKITVTTVTYRHREDTLKWIGRMSNIQTCAREIVDNEMIYQ